MSRQHADAYIADYLYAYGPGSAGHTSTPLSSYAHRWLKWRNDAGTKPRRVVGWHRDCIEVEQRLERELAR